MYKTDRIRVTYFTAEMLLEALQKAIAKYGIENVSLDHNEEYGYIGVYLACIRPCTEEEKAANEEQAAQYRAAQYRQYLILKKTFDV